MLDTMLQILGVFIMIGIGFVATKLAWFSENFSTQLSTLIIRIFYPCLLFSAILQKYTITKILDNWILPVGAAGIILVGWAVGAFVTRFMRPMRAPTRRAFCFSCTMNNYSFLPIMLIIGTPLGEEGVAMVALTTIGSDTLMWTLGVRAFTGQKIHLRTLPQTILRPPTVALILAILSLVALHFVGWTPETLNAHTSTRTLLSTLYKYLGGATIPVSALVCGMRLATLNLRNIFSPMQGLISAFRMLLIPAITLTILILLPIDANVRFVLGTIALMPCAMFGVSLAEVYGGDVPFISASIFNTHILCIFTVPLGLWILTQFNA